jgi:hypothetical protein
VALELYRTGGDPMAAPAQFAYVTAVDPATNTVTLNVDLTAVGPADQHRLRWLVETAIFKWSRDNGCVATPIEGINGKEVAVRDLGPDGVLGFAPGQWVEISDDWVELVGEQDLSLEAMPAQLLQIASVTPGPNPVVTLKSVPAPWGPAGGLDMTRHPKLRRWDGVAAAKRHPSNPDRDWIELESGAQVRFSAGSYNRGDHWLIPARTATADAQSGKLEWPTAESGEPLPLPPAGIRHHYCRLAVLQFDGETITSVEDCRNLFPPLTELTGKENGFHITDVFIGGEEPLRNGFDLHVTHLAKGIRVECDKEVSAVSVKGKPVCFVTLELPVPFNNPDFPSPRGFQPLILAADLDSDQNVIIWRPTEAAADWLREVVVNVEENQRVLARLTLKGNFIWAQDDPDLFLDGDVFGHRQEGTGNTDLRLPSGDGRRGGDFEMWFWLIFFGPRLAVKDHVVLGGVTTQGTVFLSGVAPTGGVRVTLITSDRSVATVPPSVTVPAGAAEAVFPIETKPRPGQVRVVATVTSVFSLEEQLTTVTFKEFTIEPPEIEESGPLSMATGKVTLTGPAPPGEHKVALTGDAAGVADFPQEVRLVEGQSEVSFTIQGKKVGSIEIRATLQHLSRVATLEVKLASE